MEITSVGKLNKYQTPITEELLEGLTKYEKDQLLTYISSVPYIRNLIAPEGVRGFAKDRPRNDGGKIIVDISNPHMLSDMDYFKERAIFFLEHGKYTDLRPNPNPKSEYSLFWKEEARRWVDGVVRPSDGEWIPGPLYFYWNYIQIAIVEKIEGTKKGRRIKAFPRIYLGDYLFYHYCDQAQMAGSHGKMLKARGVGASFKFAAMSPHNMYTKKGSENPNFHLASDKGFLLGDKGIWGKILDNLDFIANNTPFPRLRLTDKKQAMELQLGFEDEFGIRRGLLTSVYGISLKDNPDKARGIRGPLIHYEEDGLFPNLEKAWNVNREATEEDGIAYGFMFAAGTGGVSGSSFEGSEKLFYKPHAYNIYGIPNLYDKNSNGATNCGFFWGAYLNRGESVTKENGEPDVIAGILNTLKERVKIIDNAVDPQAITQKKAESPITPQEAVMRVEGTIFPISDLKDYVEVIYPDYNKMQSTHYIGELISTGDGVKWKPNRDVFPIRKHQVSDNIEGAIELFEEPKKNPDGKIDGYRYIAGIDPVDDDTGSSLCSIFIFDMLTDRIVAEYTGRPRFADDFYEICRKMLIYYNAKANYENNKKGLFSYFSRKNSLHLLVETPQILRDQDLVKSSGYGNKALGTNATAGINIWARRMIRDWLLEKAYSQDFDDNGEEVGCKLNMHTIRGLALLDELIGWNSDGNFDRVSSLGMVMILRADRAKLVEQISDDRNTWSPKADDPYFN